MLPSLSLQMLLSIRDLGGQKDDKTMNVDGKYGTVYNEIK